MKKLLMTIWLFWMVPICLFPQVLVLGNPSDAAANDGSPNNYLLVHDGFILSYNKSRGTANWVAWHLSAIDLGPVKRTNSFRADPKLPADWRIKKSDYDNSGYHRGHMCPSEDRSDSLESNRETFLMSNMQPQVLRLNSGTWKSLEGYVQGLARKGFEAYITAGCYGDKGLIGGKVVVPRRCWKIVVLLREGNGDLRRITRATRVIAVDMPNDTSILSGWRNYLVTVDEIEATTGYDFLTTLQDSVESALEAKKDGQ